MRKRMLVAANWKLNPSSLEEAKRITAGTKRMALKTRGIDVAICPPFVFLHPLASSKAKSPKNLHWGAQNVAAEEKGAFTGEVSADMIKDSGARFVIIGHSERRAMGETNEIIRKKLERAFNVGLTPILCIGERERDKDGGHLEFIKTQIKECLAGLQKKYLVGMTIAYEPIWAIGKSYKESMSPTDVHETTLFIKKAVGDNFGRDIAASARILYGGSVEAENALSIVQYGNIDGFLVGHASLHSEQFAEILKAADRAK